MGKGCFMSLELIIHWKFYFSAMQRVIIAPGYLVETLLRKPV